MSALDVWLAGRRAGRLEQRDGRLRFAYIDDYVEAGGPPLSCSLPLGAAELDREADAFFANLLPEGELRTVLARRVGVSSSNVFGLLEAVGGDCAGAVSLLTPGARPEPPDPDRVRWLDEDELAAALAELPSRPLLADPEEGIRLSLAGAQDKLPVVVRDGRIGIPLGPTPSTHIVKTPIERFDDTVTNEAFCLALARELGLAAAAAEIRHAGGRELLLVERYDRRIVDARGEGDRATDGRVERIHQEDFCQALAIPPQVKYEAEGGPGFGHAFELLRRAADDPAAALLGLLDAATLNFLIGNNDAHGKNFSLLFEPDGPRLAPLYDLVSTVVYPGLHRKMAMAIGGEYRPDYVRRRHIERFAAAAQLGPAAVRRRMLALAERTIAMAPAARERFDQRPVLDQVTETIEQRAGWLRRELAG